MNLKDLAYWFNDFWTEFRREKSGLIGLAILATAVLVVVFEPLILPFKGAAASWRNINYWEDNSPNAPPVWTNLLPGKDSAVTGTIKPARVSEATIEGGAVATTWEFEYVYQYDLPPLDLIMHLRATGNLTFQMTLQRPDGKSILLSQASEHGLANGTIRMAATAYGRDACFAFLKQYENADRVGILTSSDMKVTDIAFAEAKEGMFDNPVAQKGKYRILVTAIGNAGTDKVESCEIIVAGRVSGLLGTDNLKRDLFSGIVAGLKWALLIGLFVSFVSVIIGVMYGIIAAYFGGMIDKTMMFIYYIVNSIPVLPILIVFSAVFKPSLMTIIWIMIIFSWTGSVMTVRSMALQIKEETYIEAARALGSGHARIIFKHMAPLLIPYSFASMALSVPGFIVFESSLSLLGLGDPTIVTWGAILHDAMLGNAMLNGVWWWIIPPGLLIAIMGMTFAFLGFAMDKILHPKLRTR